MTERHQPPVPPSPLKTEDIQAIVAHLEAALALADHIGAHLIGARIDHALDQATQAASRTRSANVATP